RDVVPGEDHGDLEAAGPRIGQVLHGPQCGVVRTGAAHGVVDLGGRAVEGDLDVDVVTGSEPTGYRGGDLDAVGRELHAHVVGRRVVDELPEVRAHRRLAAADVDVEHLHPLELVDDRLALRGRQLARVPPPRRGQ